MNKVQKHRLRMTVASGAIGAVIAALMSVAPASAASATTGVDAAEETKVLTELRQNLVRYGSSSDIAAFDALDTAQRDELASYFLDPEVEQRIVDAARTPRGGSTVSGTETGFQWGWSGSPDQTEQDGRASSRTTWGTQWFAFAGIKLTETKVSETYEYSGTTARRMLGYSCTVVRNVQPFTQVSTSKNSGYISGGQATATCKVVVNRGAFRLRGARSRGARTPPSSDSAPGGTAP